MLPLRGVGPVVPVPESAVDQFAGLSCARPQSGFCGESVCSADAAEQLSWSVATFRGELGADAFPPASAFRRRMFALSRSSCSSRSPFFENRARPLPAFLYYCLPFEAPNSYCDRRPRELARACPCGCVASVGGVFWCGRGAKQGPQLSMRCPGRAKATHQCLRRFSAQGGLGGSPHPWQPGLRGGLSHVTLKGIGTHLHLLCKITEI